MKNLIILFVSLLFISACITPQRYSIYVREGLNHYDTVINVSGKSLTFKYDSIKTCDTLVKVSGKYNCVPALIFWDVKEIFDCELNARIPVKIFSEACREFADSMKFAEKLAGQRLEINITSIPQQFEFYEEDQVFLFIFANKQYIAPLPGKLEFAYRFYDGTTIAAQGKISIDDNEHALGKNMVSEKKLTRLYLGQYYENIEYLARQAMVKLNNVIPKTCPVK